MENFSNSKKKKKWNKKVITTANQWRFNDRGSAGPADASMINLSYAMADALGVNARELNFNF